MGSPLSGATEAPVRSGGNDGQTVAEKAYVFKFFRLHGLCASCCVGYRVYGDFPLARSRDEWVPADDVEA